MPGDLPRDPKRNVANEGTLWRMFTRWMPFLYGANERRHPKAEEPAVRVVFDPWLEDYPFVHHDHIQAIIDAVGEYQPDYFARKELQGMNLGPELMASVEHAVLQKRADARDRLVFHLRAWADALQKKELDGQ